MSDVAFFHKAGDVVPEREHLHNDDQRIIDLLEEQNSGLSPEAEKSLEMVEVVRENIDAVVLEDGGAKEEKVLGERKAKANRYIEDVFEAAKAYMQVIHRQNLYRSDNAENLNLSQNDAKEKEIEIDVLRKQKHEVMIDAINIANRYIKQNFCEMSEEDIEKFEDKLIKLKQPVISVERFPFPAHGICPDYVDTTKRESVTLWASQIVNKMTKSI